MVREPKSLIGVELFIKATVTTWSSPAYGTTTIELHLRCVCQWSCIRNQELWRRTLLIVPTVTPIPRTVLSLHRNINAFRVWNLLRGLSWGPADCVVLHGQWWGKLARGERRTNLNLFCGVLFVCSSLAPTKAIGHELGTSATRAEQK